MKISIIIPVYNSKKYLQKCLDSVINQGYSDMEVILVDDGSTDGSSIICDNNVAKHSFITVIHKKNEGVSTARNIGIKRAKGKYIFFLDSDDIMLPQVLQKVDKLLGSEPDLIIGNYITWNSSNNTEEIKVKIVNKFNNIYNLCEFYAKNNEQIPWDLYQFFWNKNIIEKNKIKFNPKISIGEDCLFYFQYIKNINNFKVVSFPFVKYRYDSENSLMKSINTENIISQMKVFYYLFCTINNRQLKQYFADKYTSMYFQIELLNSKFERNKCYEYGKNKFYVFKRTSNKKKYKLFKTMIPVMGIKGSSKLMCYLRKIKHIKTGQLY